MIRSVEERDYPVLTDIYNWYIAHSIATFETETLTTDTFARRIEEIRAHYPYIIIGDDRPEGYAYLNHFNARAAYDWSADLSIYVDHNCRGRGLGLKLMQAILKMAEKDGYVNVISIVTEGNAASIGLHEKAGFVKAGYFPDAGYKMGRWLGVNYFMKQVGHPENVPEAPKNYPYL